jgi:hypothetical protein
MCKFIAMRMGEHEDSESDAGRDSSKSDLSRLSNIRRTEVEDQTSATDLMCTNFSCYSMTSRQFHL